MRLEELVQKNIRIDGNRRFLELSNGFGISCEITEDVIKYDTTYGPANIFPVINCNRENKPEKSRTIFHESAEIFNNYIEENYSNEYTRIEDRLREIHSEMLEPLDVEEIKKRHIGNYAEFLSFNLGITLTYPISLPLAFGYYITKGLIGKGSHGDQYGLWGVMAAPLILLELISKEERDKFLKKNPVSMRIKNKDILKEEPKENYVGIGDKRLDPDFFGHESLMEYGKSILAIYLENGLELRRSTTYYPSEGNHFNECRYFIPARKELIEEINELYSRKKYLLAEYHQFNDLLNPEDIDEYFHDNH